MRQPVFRSFNRFLLCAEIDQINFPTWGRNNRMDGEARRCINDYEKERVQFDRRGERVAPCVSNGRQRHRTFLVSGESKYTHAFEWFNPNVLDEEIGVLYSFLMLRFWSSLHSFHLPTDGRPMQPDFPNLSFSVIKWLHELH